ncbi:sensor domain-containing diguanylate cyclase [Candidatus Oleimmundimicrobium sp.]|uniref:sensor domain-containing diguanylate cyclase n=1 Tax=Candidatus Oleimmundimicrobium sp. TaxID=3060597 RepID=UPI00271F22A0|nr:sensor domain-containing diguanylate cyclase [Candidatus Oleimmundimicrobium sp.]MDO8885642.1 sensor domain-containing diguanylate cyclase [Candidatus Oleimmundimicrobium sp.]
MKKEFQEKLEIFEKIQWLIKLRWIVVSCAFIVIWLTKMLAPTEFFATPFYILAGLIACYNLLFGFYLESLNVEDDEDKAKKFANMQVSLDIAILAMVVYFTGGAESPFISVFILHIITAGISLTTKESFMQATLALTLVTSIVVLEYFSIIPHHELAILYPLPYNQYTDGRFVITIIFKLSIMFFFTVYLISYLSSLLNKKQEGTRELSTLLNISKSLGSTLELDSILNLILNTAISETGTSAGSIALFDEEKEELGVRAAKGFSEEFLNKTLKWKLRKDGVTDMILKGEKPLVIEDSSKEPAFNSSTLLNEGVKSLIAVPLFTDHKTIGILYVDDFKPREFTESEVRLVSFLATQAAVAINNAQFHEKTKRLAITDGLTGVYNHRYFSETLESEAKRANRYHSSLSLTMIDVDDFKIYNDTHGHLEGDILLTKIAYFLVECTREIDLIARYGGDEFAIISPETDKEQAFEMAERIKAEIADKFLKEREIYAIIKLSFGVASLPCDAVDADDLIKKADEALYQAKRAKKKKVYAFKASTKGA